MRNLLARTSFIAAFSMLLAAPLQAQVVVTDYFQSGMYQYNLNGSGLQGVLNAPAMGPSPPNTGANGLLGPGGVTIGPDNNIYYSNRDGGSILKYDTASGAVSTFISNATLSTIAGPGNVYSPAALRFAPDGNLYVTRSGGVSAADGTGAIDKFDGTTGVQVSGSFTGLFQPNGMTIAGADLYVSNLGTPGVQGSVTKIAGFMTGTPTVTNNYIASGVGGLDNPTGMSIGPDGKLYIADVSYSGAFSGVRRYDITANPVLGTPDPSLTLSLPAQFPSDVVFTPDGTKMLVATLGLPQFGIPGALNAYTLTGVNGATFDSTIASGFGAASIAFNFVPLPVPEPMALMALALVGGLVLRRKS